MWGGEKKKNHLFLAEMLVFFHSPLGVENQDVSDSSDVNVGGSDFNVRRNSEFSVFLFLARRWLWALCCGRRQCETCLAPAHHLSLAQFTLLLSGAILRSPQLQGGVLSPPFALKTRLYLQKAAPTHCHQCRCELHSIRIMGRGA